MSDNKYNNVMHLGNPTNTIAVLNRYGFDFKKKFGQNFLIDENVVEKIVREAGVTKDDFVVEVGPGIGTMTQILCENAREVVAVEIDKKLIPILTEDTLSYYDNVTVINEDILKLDIKKLADEKNDGRPIKVVANLPYYITTPIIMGLFESHVPLDSITIMVQKEVADRMQCGPGTKDYGALSLADSSTPSLRLCLTYLQAALCLVLMLIQRLSVLNASRHHLLMLRMNILCSG